MTFIITLIALIMERFFYWHHLRQWQWFINYERWLSEHSMRLPALLRLGISLVAPLVIVGWVEYLLSGWFYGIFQLFFGVFILLYCLGPHNLWSQVYRCIEELQKDDVQSALEQAKQSFGVTATHNSQMFHKSLVRAIFIAAHERLFAVIFWFVILGPVGAVLYRLIELFSVRKELDLTDIASQAKQVMDWLPIRIFTFIFALGGHFTEVFSCWKKDVKNGIHYNETLLGDCGIAALDVMEANIIPEKGAAEQEAIELLDRVFAMVLVILAMIIIVV